MKVLFYSQQKHIQKLIDIFPIKYLIRLNDIRANNYNQIFNMQWLNKLEIILIF